MSSAPRSRISDRSLHVLTTAPTHSVLLKLWGTTQEAETEAKKELEKGKAFSWWVTHACEGRDTRHPDQGCNVNFRLWYHEECSG